MNGWEKRQFFALRFWRSRRKGSSLKIMAGALHTDGGGCMLSVGGKSKWKFRLKLVNSTCSAVWATFGAQC